MEARTTLTTQSPVVRVRPIGEHGGVATTVGQDHAGDRSRLIIDLGLVVFLASMMNWIAWDLELIMSRPVTNWT